MTDDVPLEETEQIRVVQFLEVQSLKFTSVPNSTYTTSWKQKTRNRLTGLRAGFPDLIILIRPDQARDGLGKLLAVELKRTKRGIVSPQQREWIAALNGLGIDQVESVVAHGADEVIEYLSEYLRVLEVQPRILTVEF
ncbi:hypothetical protein B5P43_18270 [Bacillus sp. SRB_336]|nr:hypothetical protein B5P43_18270 [Bacillus sp. SRB_336]